MHEPRTGERGQAAVELAALLPFLALLIAACWQVVLVAQASWSAADAAHAAARASAIGTDPEAAARRSLPAAFERRLHVTAERGETDVRVRVPSLVPAVSLGTVTAHGSFRPQA